MSSQRMTPYPYPPIRGPGRPGVILSSEPFLYEISTFAEVLRKHHPVMLRSAQRMGLFRFPNAFHDQIQRAIYSALSACIPGTLTSYYHRPDEAIPREPLDLYHPDHTPELAPMPITKPFPFFALPAEIRNKVYRMLLKTDIPIVPIIEPEISFRYYYRTAFNTSIMFANHTLHQEAEAVLYGDNEFILQLPAMWSGYRENDICKEEVQMPPPSAIRLLQNVHLEIFLKRDCNFRRIGQNQPAAGTAKLKRDVGDFVAKLMEVDEKGKPLGHRLKNLNVRFTNKVYNENDRRISPTMVRHTFDKPTHSEDREGSGRRFHKSCCVNGYGYWYWGRGVRTFDWLENKCKGFIKTDQKVLEPLLGLRGVKKVTVKGRLEDGWASELEEAMTAPM